MCCFKSQSLRRSRLEENGGTCFCIQLDEDQKQKQDANKECQDAKIYTMVKVEGLSSIMQEQPKSYLSGS